jgi:hypothetical protein
MILTSTVSCTFLLFLPGTTITDNR